MKGAALFLLFCGAALAQNTPSPPPESPAAAGGTRLVVEDAAAARRLFEELDRNGDGYLTPDELGSNAGHDDNWMAVDRNRDGRISPDEFRVLRKP